MKKIKFYFLCLGLLLISGAAAYFLFFSGFFKTETAQVEGELSCADSRELLTDVKIIGSNIFLIDSSQIAKKLQTDFSCIKSAKIIKKFPKRILLQVRNREGQASLYIIKDTSVEATSSAIEESFLLDGEGELFVGSEDMTPKIYSSTKNINFKNILAILNKIKIFGIEVMEAVVTENNLLINSTPKIVLDLSKDFNMQIASLQLILQQAKIDEETMEFIDLRFDKPVVRFAPKKK